MDFPLVLLKSVPAVLRGACARTACAVPGKAHLLVDVLACQLYKADIVRDVYATEQAVDVTTVLETTFFGQKLLIFTALRQGSRAGR
jgi:hypothetical protein